MLHTDLRHLAQAACWGMTLVYAAGLLTAQQNAQVEPIRIFDIQKVWADVAPAGKVGQVIGRRSLYFLVSPTFSTYDASVVRTNGSGRVEQIIKLPPKAFIQGFEVDAAGMVYVLALPKGTDQADVFIYRPDGALARTVPVSHHVIWLCAAGDGMFTVAGTDTGFVFAPVGSEASPVGAVTVQRSPSRLLAFPLPDGRIAAMETSAGVVHLIDLQRASAVSVRPRVPEMQGLATLPPGDHTRNTVFGDGVAAPDGQLYLMIGNYTVAEGIPVVSFHMNGNLFQTIRYKLPKFLGETEVMAPSRMTVLNGDTLVLAGADGKVAEYPL